MRIASNKVLLPGEWRRNICRRLCSSVHQILIYSIFVLIALKGNQTAEKSRSTVINQPEYSLSLLRWVRHKSSSPLQSIKWQMIGTANYAALQCRVNGQLDRHTTMHHQLATIGILIVARKPIFRPADELSVATDLALALSTRYGYESETCSFHCKLTRWASNPQPSKYDIDILLLNQLRSLYINRSEENCGR